MPIALVPGKKDRYVLKRERALPPEKQTVFIIQSLEAAEQYVIRERAIAAGMFSLDLRFNPLRERLTLASGLAGWENFFGPDNVAIPFQYGEDSGKKYCHLNNLTKLTEDDRVEIATAITALNTVNEDDQKNCPSPPAS